MRGLEVQAGLRARQETDGTFSCLASSWPPHLTSTIVSAKVWTLSTPAGPQSTPASCPLPTSVVVCVDGDDPKAELVIAVFVLAQVQLALVALLAELGGERTKSAFLLLRQVTDSDIKLVNTLRPLLKLVHLPPHRHDLLGGDVDEGSAVQALLPDGAVPATARLGGAHHEHQQETETLHNSSLLADD